MDGYRMDQQTDEQLHGIGRKRDVAQKVSINNKKTWETEDSHPNKMKIQRE